tara:strand:+ start:208 stop:432 length:225 start_codon:yes stop_codon:yes gene_type:complete
LIYLQDEQKILLLSIKAFVVKMASGFLPLGEKMGRACLSCEIVAILFLPYEPIFSSSASKIGIFEGSKILKSAF